MNNKTPLIPAVEEAEQTDFTHYPSLCSGIRSEAQEGVFCPVICFKPLCTVFSTNLPPPALKLVFQQTEMFVESPCESRVQDPRGVHAPTQSSGWDGVVRSITAKGHSRVHGGSQQCQCNEKIASVMAG